MRFALLQTAPVSGLEDGMKVLADAADRAAGQGADLLITPEMFLTGYNIPVDTLREAAGRMDDTIVRELARDAGIGLLVGMPDLTEYGTLYNTALLIDDLGVERARYRKTHLFGDLDRDRFSAGDTLSPVVEFRGWKLALAICYDIEFPELARSLTLAGAEAILVPTANMKPYESICTRIVPARAEENGVAIAYVNQCGPEGEMDYCGLSCLCGPDGGDLARAGTVPDLIFADLDREPFDAVRANATHLIDRRPSLYRDPT